MIDSLALLPSRNFAAVFESQCVLQYFTQEAKVCFTRSMYQFVSNMMSASVLLAKSYGNEAKYKQ